MGVSKLNNTVKHRIELLMSNKWENSELSLRVMIVNDELHTRAFVITYINIQNQLPPSWSLHQVGIIMKAVATAVGYYMWYVIMYTRIWSWSFTMDRRNRRNPAQDISTADDASSVHGGSYSTLASFLITPCILNSIHMTPSAVDVSSVAFSWLFHCVAFL